MNIYEIIIVRTHIAIAILYNTIEFMSVLLIEGLLSRYDNINPINIRMIYSNLLFNLCNATFSK